MKIFLIAGEESGDILGAGLMKSLKEKYPDTDISFRGIGGSRMEKLGLKCLFPMQELSLMGIAEILPKVPHLLGRIKETIQAVGNFEPDIFLTIDSPDFCFRVAKGLKGKKINIPLKAPYVAPTVWAWRPKRASKVAGQYDAVLCLFPFEPEYFEKEGMKAKFVGHPMSYNLKDIKSASFISDYNLEKYDNRVGVLLGSRQSEIQKMAPVFLGALKNITYELQNSCLVVPTLPHLQDQVTEELKKYDFSCPVIITADPENKYEAMKSCDMAVATSGTVGLELSVLDVPHLIAYKMSSLTYEIGKRMIATKYAHLSNILLQKEVVPEFIQEAATEKNISICLTKIINDRSIGDAQRMYFNDVRQMIRGADSESPSDICADFIMDQVRDLHLSIGI